MIGIYEGDKEPRECIEAVFGSLINEIQETCKNTVLLLKKSQSMSKKVQCQQII